MLKTNKSFCCLTLWLPDFNRVCQRVCVSMCVCVYQKDKEMYEEKKPTKKIIVKFINKEKKKANNKMNETTTGKKRKINVKACEIKDTFLLLLFFS